MGIGALEQAHQAMMQHSFEAPKEQASPQPGGQEIQSQETPSWSNNQESGEKAELSEAENNQLINEILELDKYDKFKWQGKEWSRDELSNSIMFQRDYTRKMQELKTQRDYAQNVAYDFLKVLSNPALAADFKKLYPQDYHDAVDELLRYTESQSSNKLPQKGEGKEAQDTTNLPPEVVSRLDRIEMSLKQREQEVFQANVEAYKKEVDQICDKMAQKYKFADVDAVLAGANSLASSGKPLDEKTWEALFKSSNEHHQKRYESYQKELFEKQKSASGKAKDMGQGGAIPGSPPKKFKNMAEAREAMLEHISNAQRR